MTLVLVTLSMHHPHHRPHHLPPRPYARKLVLERWHSLAEWRAEVAIVIPESGFNPCSVYPGQHLCGYTGSNSCGIPQANPCPAAWRGRLYATRFLQVIWLQHYIAGRYGDPLRALWFRQAHGWF